MNIYSIKVKSLKCYQRPFPAHDDGNAIASVRETLRLATPGDLERIKIDDLELFCLSCFDSKNGITKARPKKIIDLVDIPGLVDVVKEVLTNVESN